MSKVIEFLTNLLTDRIDNIKADALAVYTELIQTPPPQMVTRSPSYPFVTEDVIHTFAVPYGDGSQTISIPARGFREVLRYLQQGQKINAIKAMRQNGHYGNGETPGLKDSKDLVESFDITPLLG